MPYIENLFDLSTLDIENINLADIPEFTIEDFSELKELHNQNETFKASMSAKDDDRLMTLQFLKAADSARDFSEDDSFPEYDEAHRIRALQNFARAKLIK